MSSARKGTITKQISLGPPDENLYLTAIDDHTDAIEHSPDNADLYAGRAYFYHLLGENRQAIADYTSAIELDPDNPELYYLRARRYDVIKEYEAAIADYTRTVIELDPTTKEHITGGHGHTTP